MVVVEGAEPDELSAPGLECDVLADDSDDVGGIAHPVAIIGLCGVLTHQHLPHARTERDISSSESAGCGLSARGQVVSFWVSAQRERRIETSAPD